MLFDPMVVVREPLAVLITVAIIIIGKTTAAVGLVLLLRYPLNTALTVGASLAQIGEFSFILAGLGVSLRLMPEKGQSLVLAGSLISIAMNPLVFAAVEPLRRWIHAKSSEARRFERSPDPLSELPMTVDQALLTGQVVLVGYGRVGKRIAASLTEHSIPYVVIEENREYVETLRRQNVPAVSGNAGEAAVLIQGHIARAGMLVVATPDTVHVRRMVEVARMLNPKIDIVLRTHSEEEAELLRREKAGAVFMGEHELALGMTRHVLDTMARRATDAATAAGPVSRTET
jgi:monovalent cation:H+ antiporter-2, CPA2 family